MAKRRKHMTEKTVIFEDSTPTVHAYWIQDRKESSEIKGTYDFLPSCTCSACGYHAERPIGLCPQCDAIMDAAGPAAALTEEG